MERKIGEIFTYNGKTYQVVEVESDEECKGCAFEFRGYCMPFLGDCHPTYRTDGVSAIFKEINNMENNQLTIDIPEGMEIDLENSDLAKGIVKFKKKDITYDDVLQAYATDFGGIRVPNHCIDKILAISQLMNIAKYYNGDWKPNWVEWKPKYLIVYNSNNNTYIIDWDYSYTCDYVYFKNKEDAIAVINNPNFRGILDAIYKN